MPTGPNGEKRPRRYECLRGHDRVALRQANRVSRSLTLTVASMPRVERQEWLTLAREAPRLWRAELRYGFMEHPDVPGALAECRSRGCEVDLDDVTYYVGGETILSRDDRLGIPRWEEAPFSAMARNAAAISDYLKLPNEHVVEIGRRISI